MSDRLGPLVGLLIPVLAVAVVVGIIRAARRKAAGEEPAAGSLRRALQYGFLLVALVAGANGLVLVVQSAMPQELLAEAGAAQLALGLALTVVAVPAWILLWRAVRARLATSLQERGSAAWSLYLAVAATVSLVLALGDAVEVGAWALGAAPLSAQAVAGAAVWAAVWSGHQLLARHSALAPRHLLAEAGPLGGSVVGLIALAIGTGGVLVFGFTRIYEAVAGDAVATAATTEALRRNLVLGAIAAVVWWWHWWRQAVHGPRSGLWHLVVLAVPYLGGLVAALGAAGILLDRVLEWWWGAPAAATAAAHFQDLPVALATLLVGSATWRYHSTVLKGPAGRVRAEPDRVRDHLLSAVGLLAAVAGGTVAVMSVIQALAPHVLAGTDPEGRNAAALAATLLVLALPLWATTWHRLQRGARADTAEAGSITRRAYLVLLSGALGLAAVVSLVVVLYVVLRDLLDGTLGVAVVIDVRAAIGLGLCAGAASAYHWAVHQRDRVLHPPPPARASVKSVLLVSPDGRTLASQVASRTGAHVRTLHRLDAPAGPVDVDAVARAIATTPSEQVLVILDADGDVRAIPYETG